jgi:hypothetical protein
LGAVAELLSLGAGEVPSDDEVDREQAARKISPTAERKNLWDAMKVP